MTRRLVIALAALVAAVALALAIPLSVIVERDQRAAFVSQMEVDTLTTSVVLAAQPRSRWPAIAREVATRTGARVVVVDTDRLLVADSDQTGLDRSFDRVEVDQALQGRVASDVRFSATLAEDLRYVAAPVVQDGGIVAAVRLTLPDSQVDAFVLRTQLLLALFVLAVVVAAALVAWLIAHSIAAPLRRVATAAEALSDDLGVRAPQDDGPPEVRSVARALNGTAGRLAALIDRQQRVAEDASHHLRTPLTGVRLRLEAIEDESDEPAIRTEAAAAIGEVDRLSRRIEQVLHLARTDAGQAADRVDVAAIARLRCQAASAAAQSRGLALHLDIPDRPVRVLAATGSVDRIVDELVGNALTYAARTVTVNVSTDDGTVALRVADDGRGVAPEDRERIFERFVRGTGAARGGSGLGLALVREAARAAGGDAIAVPGPDGGLAVRVTWPQAPS